MKQISIMIKPASALCNLRCRYCFYADVAEKREVPSYGIMTEETTERLLTNVRDWLSPGDTVSFAFQGGEPTLAGLPYFQRFAELVKQWDSVRVQFAFQTNGILLDEDWCTFFRENKVLVGVSWDLLPDCHDAARVDADGNGTNKTVQNAVRLLEKNGVEYNILCTLTNFIARHPEQVWKQLVRNDIRYVQFTPCLGALDASADDPYALTPRRFASFYDRLFSLWYEDFRNGSYRSVKYFDDLVNLMAFGRPNMCGIDGKCRPQLVTEADGSVYPCDFYCMDDYCLGNLAHQPLAELLASPKIGEFACREHTMPTLCTGCPYAKLCGGGCKRMQKEIACFRNDSFCGIQTFLRAHGEQLRSIAAEERRLRKDAE